MSDKESILVNPDFSLDEAYRQKKKKQGIVMVRSEDVTLNPEYAKYDRIRSHLLNRNGQLTIVFRWDDTFKRYDVGIGGDWGFVYGTPPDKAELEIPFADALFDAWVEMTKKTEQERLIRLDLTGGIV